VFGLIWLHTGGELIPSAFEAF